GTNSSILAGNTTATTGGLAVAGWQGLQIEVVGPATINLAPNASSATRANGTLGLFHYPRKSRPFATQFTGRGIQQIKAATDTIATSLDPTTLLQAEYIDGTAAAPASYQATGAYGVLTIDSKGNYTYTATTGPGGTDVFTVKTVDQSGFITDTTLTFNVLT